LKLIKADPVSSGLNILKIMEGGCEDEFMREASSFVGRSEDASSFVFLVSVSV